MCNGFASNFDLEKITSKEVKIIYDNSLTLLYRLLFAFYAEARELLPLTANQTYRDQYSLHSLTREIDEIVSKGHQLSSKSHIYYERINSLFQLIDGGDPVLEVPEYNGGLFDNEEHEFLKQNGIPDTFLVHAIHQLARIYDKKLGHEVAVDYNTLSERHLGGIYEGLLEFKPQIALSDLVAIKGKGSIKLADAKKHPEIKVAYKKYELYLSDDNGERKTTGSYYTPEYIVRYIVENALDPLIKRSQNVVYNLKSKVDSEIGEWQKLESNKKLEIGDLNRKVADAREKMLEPYLALKILDPAMGSGHFLSAATDFLAVAIATDPSIEPNPEISDESELAYYRRRVVESCIYGVDLNPLAVELAKLTLWLTTMAKAKPLSFLNHHLKVGNSLIGAKVRNLDEIPKIKRGKKWFDTSRAPIQVGQFEWRFNNKITVLLESRALIAELPTETLDDVHKKEKWELDFQQNAKRFRLLGDIWASTYFGNVMYWDTYNTLLDNIQSNETDWARLTQDKAIVKAKAVKSEKQFFHWELEFPEVWYERDGKRKVNPGFDAVIGNPPYDVFNEGLYEKLSEASGCGNLAGHFVTRGAEMVNEKGAFGMVLPLSISSGRDFENVRQYIYKRFGKLRATHYSIRPAKLFPGVDQRISILVALGCGQHPCMVESSRLYRFREGDQTKVVLNAKVGGAGSLSEGYIPRVGDEIGARIYKKLKNLEIAVRDYCAKPDDSEGICSLWFHSVGRYWLKAYNFMPYFRRGKELGVSTKLYELKMASKEAAITTVGLVNSSLFYFWWMLQSDEFDLLGSQILSFPIQKSLLKDKNIEDAVDKLMEDYKAKAIRKKIVAGGEKIEMDEIHARLSRERIRDIDKIIGTYYDLLDDEKDYLDTYDEEFRTDEE